MAGVGIPEILAQMVALTDMVATQTARIQALEASSGGQQGHGGNNVKGSIFDNRTSEPEKLQRIVDFKEFVEDYREYIEIQDSNLADLLDLARDSKIPILHAGIDPETQRKAKALYRSLKRCITHPEAKSIVQNVNDKNPFEAWRQLFMKFDPRNDTSSQNLVDTILNKKNWQCSKLSEVAVKLGQWEALIREHKTRTGEDAINATSQRQLFKCMLPADVRRFVEVQTMFQPTLSYEVLKGVVMDLVQRVTDLPIPMDTSSFEQPTGKGNTWEREPGPMDSLGYRPPQKLGKGQGGKGDGSKVGKGDGGKGQKETRTCHNCNKVGHIAKDC